jgi:hypothetical protein
MRIEPFGAILEKLRHFFNAWRMTMSNSRTQLDSERTIAETIRNHWIRFLVQGIFIGRSA